MAKDLRIPGCYQGLSLTQDPPPPKNGVRSISSGPCASQFDHAAPPPSHPAGPLNLFSLQATPSVLKIKGTSPALSMSLFCLVIPPNLLTSLPPSQPPSPRGPSHGHLLSAYNQLRGCQPGLGLRIQAWLWRESGSAAGVQKPQAGGHWEFVETK